MSLADALRKANLISEDQLNKIKKEKERKIREEERKAYQERNKIKPIKRDESRDEEK